MTKPHIHADLITLYATIAHITNEPWLHFQYREYYGEEWSDCRGPIEFWFDHEYRLKPRTIKIGSFDVPEPVRESLKEEAEYFHVDTGFLWDDDGVSRSWWLDSDVDKARLSAGLIHLTREAAELHAKALISLSKNNT
ncbi:hypothetical protein [Xenorhabdus szentirmaii]|uniref:Uncharacterized protein n=1 Tax=Xenorhabdus szentirmaii DSM 16338 TaxID=1427518 RepID=W1J5R9_9GAMM|nr:MULTISPECIES: hypothetical protein [Xenorhabdus]MBD2803472.1 hypothetical protein [Xenorhabdus sp. ZM]PHM31984.1 hypothetical protein Xsze_02712 [Xenorhabdus szentirmaii DSM 16338]CDL85388.1 hypothetical protein XSR1_70126 [Xenorhabdus szentirmaii DSM 16338]